MKIRILMALAITMLVACEEKAPEATASQAEAPAEAKKSKVKDKIAELKAKAKDGDDPTKDMKRKWELKVDGMPTLDGFSVMKSKIATIDKYSFLGSDALYSVDMDAGKDEVRGLVAHYTKTKDKLSCSYMSGQKGGSKGLTVKISGKRGEITGEVNCRNLDEKDAKPTTHKATGWFEL